ncbi:MAG: tetratricopeptide repeat protein [Acidobacteria bacterium]|nr:tetratricopeptide repeat protein [Acidobacteriota bacterium]
MAERKQSKTTSKTTDAETPSNNSTSTNSVMFLTVGLLLGLVVGYVFTNNVNKTAPSTKSAKGAKAGPLKDGQEMPANHPSVGPDPEVEKEIQLAIESGEKNQDYDSQLKAGSYLYQQGQVDIAKKFLLKANELKPNEFAPLVNLGNLHFDLGQQNKDSKMMQQAIEWYEKALKIKPDDLSVNTDLGIAHSFLSPPDNKKALDYINKSLSKDPKHLQSLFHKTRIYIELKDLKSADETFALFKEASSSNENETIKQATAALEQELNKAKGTTSNKTVEIPTH